MKKVFQNYDFFSFYSCSGFSNDESSCSMVFVTQSNLDSNSSSQKELFVNTKMEEKSGNFNLIISAKQNACTKYVGSS